jgi:hypothetical protein
LAVHMYILPYNDPKINGLESMTLLSSIAILLCGVVFFVGGYSVTQSSVLEWTAIVILFSSGFMVLVMGAQQFYLSYVRNKQINLKEKAEEEAPYKWFIKRDAIDEDSEQVGEMSQI